MIGWGSNVTRDVHWCVTVDHRQIAKGNIANQIHGFTIDYGKFILIDIIIHQTYYEKKSDWSRAFNQFTIACELDMINAISAADIAFIMSSSKSAWLLIPLECSPQKQNGWTLRFGFWGWIMWKMYIIKQLLNSVFAWYHELSAKPRVCVICLSLRLRQITQTSALIIHDIMLNLIQ